jgi:hypothetical protein
MSSHATPGPAPEAPTPKLECLARGFILKPAGAETRITCKQCGAAWALRGSAPGAILSLLNHEAEHGARRRAERRTK